MKFVTAALVFSAVGTSEAFVGPATRNAPASNTYSYEYSSIGSPSSRFSFSPPLHLTPQQGKQLVAAYEVECTRQRPVSDDEDRIDGPGPILGGSSTPSSTDKLASARSFVSRVFSIPSAVIKRHPRQSDEDLTMLSASSQEATPFEALISLPKSLAQFASNNEHEDDDVVLYPVVGFRFFMVDGKPSVVPTSSHPACRLVPKQHEQEVFGWWTQSCKLDLYAEDPCQKPAEE